VRFDGIFKKEVLQFTLSYRLLIRVMRAGDILKNCSDFFGNLVW